MPVCLPCPSLVQFSIPLPSSAWNLTQLPLPPPTHTPQVAHAWLVAQGNTVPIPGAKNRVQAEEFAGSLGWQLAEEEVEELRQLAKKVPPVQGFPVENI